MKPSLIVLLFALLTGGPLAAAPIPLPNPDFTMGEAIREIGAMTERPKLLTMDL